MGTTPGTLASPSLPAIPATAGSPEEMKTIGLTIGFVLGVGSCITREE